MKETTINAEMEQGFHRIVEASEKLYPLLLDDERHGFSRAVDLLKHKVIPLLRHECPLLVAVTGGGSVGKSTLFNFLAGGKYSGVKSRAGYTRRTLAAIHPSAARDRARMELLFDLFRKNALPVPMKTPDEMLAPGEPLYVESPSIPEQIAVLDTPDFDTGDKDEFANRDAAEEILASSDVLVYLFTNQTYNNKANTDFVRKAISGIGRRKVVLVYRCSAAYPDDEVAEHVDTVLHNLFPDSGNPRQEALGIYRMDESDAVVRGEADPAIRPLGEGPDMVGLITGLDIVETRRDSLRSQCEAIVAKTKDAIEAADVRRWELVAYRDSVRALASHAVLGGLKNFPQGLLMEKFAECWRASQPLLVRVAHWPGRKVSGVAKWFRQKLKGDDRAAQLSAAEEYRKRFSEDFKDSVSKLLSRLSQPTLNVEVSSVSEETRELRDALRNLVSRNEEDYGISSSGREKAECSVPRPSLLKSELEKVIQAIASSGKDEWIEAAADKASFNADLAKDIKDLVDDTRSKRSFWEKSKEGLWATVATLPPIAAVAWTVCTSDPVVGTGAMAHLSALFGLGDLWATLAVPASLGLDAANRRFLENGLKGLYEKWFDRKREPILKLIEENVTDRCIHDCASLLEATEAPLSRLREAVESICNGEGSAA